MCFVIYKLRMWAFSLWLNSVIIITLLWEKLQEHHEYGTEALDYNR
jgi:hypothetical protein